MRSRPSIRARRWSAFFSNPAALNLCCCRNHSIVEPIQFPYIDLSSTQLAFNFLLSTYVVSFSLKHPVQFPPIQLHRQLFVEVIRHQTTALILRRLVPRVTVITFAQSSYLVLSTKQPIINISPSAHSSHHQTKVFKIRKPRHTRKQGVSICPSHSSFRRRYVLNFA
jgi:hypothetical protein